MLKEFCQNMGLRLQTDYDFGSLHGYKTKGIVRYYVEIDSEIFLYELLKFTKENNIKTIACGDGSNTLIRDYFDGLFIKWTDSNICILNSGDDKDVVLLNVSSGLEKSKLTDYCVENSLSGLEFWAGIPGLVGGGTAMNAGAYDTDVQHSVYDVEFVTPDGMFERKQKELNWHYRKVDLPPYVVITSVTFELKKSNQEEIKKLVDKYIKDREFKHPLDFPSCGSVFKNPEGQKHGAWWFVKEAGLTGFSIGGAKVSDKHTNFIINANGATSGDVINLISEVKRRVEDKFAVQLKEEVKII